jgi:hypothetical protein
MWQPRTFIVRLYPDGSGRTAGLVEDAGSGKQFRFTDKEELWGLLHRPVLLKSPEARLGRVRKTGKPGSRHE